MKWLNKLVGTEDAGAPDAGDPGRFDIGTPGRWLRGLHADALPAARELTADAMFVAHDPVSSDPNFLATLIVYLDAPLVESTEEFLAGQAAEMESGAASDPDVS